MKKRMLKKCGLVTILFLVTVSAVNAWKNPFQNTQIAVRQNVEREISKKTDEPSYNITLGSRFGIFVEPGIDPIEEFQRKPYIYITYDTGSPDKPKIRTKKIKILKKDSHYSSGQLEFPCQLLVCEWTNKLAPGNYELWVKPRNPGKDYEPCRVTGSFTLEKPIIQKVEQIDGADSKLVYMKVSGLYFSLTPKVYVYYTVDKNGVFKKYKQKCKIQSKTIDRISGASEAIFTFKKRTNASWELVNENSEPLVEVTNKIGSSRSTTAGNAWFTDTNYGKNPDPAFGDLDGDGDLDMIVGVKRGTLSYYENTGTTQAPVFTQRSDSANLFSAINCDSKVCPWLADMDADGDLDLLTGTYDASIAQGIIKYFENTGSATSPNFTEKTEADNPFVNVKKDMYCNPMVIDLDGDGDLDLIFTSEGKNIYYYENSGNNTNPIFNDQSENLDHPFVNIQYGDRTTVALADLDQDGDYDLTVSDTDGKFIYYKNMGTSEVAKFIYMNTNPFKDFDVGEYATPVFADLNGDDLPELVSGSRFGTLYCFKNNSRHSLTYTKPYNWWVSWFANNDFGRYPVPAFGDLDGDGDQDMVIGSCYGTFQYFLNTSQNGSTYFAEQKGEDNPFHGFDVDVYSSPYLADVDGDGDLDLVSGYYSASATEPKIKSLIYFKNIGTPTKPIFERQSEDNNPFSSLTNRFGIAVIPSLVDLDGDGDLDVVTCNPVSLPYYYSNTGTLQNPDFKLDLVFGYPFNLDISSSSIRGMTLGDTDKDGDLDLIISYSGTLRYYSNIGTKESPYFSYRDIIPDFSFRYSTPYLGDVNGDGILDILCVNQHGSLIELKGALTTTPIFN
jgi:uncharacterized protein (DUF2141 family)